MKQPHMNRRAFSKLTMAALGGVLAGARIRADEKKDDKKEEKPKKKVAKKPLLLQEPHVCRGLNNCKAKGKGGKNECAGQSACATAEAHTCGGDNECAGLGGCGAMPGENACKGKGKCHVPLEDEAWTKARKRFETEMTKAKKKVGKAPEKKSE